MCRFSQSVMTGIKLFQRDVFSKCLILNLATGGCMFDLFFRGDSLPPPTKSCLTDGKIPLC